MELSPVTDVPDIESFRHWELCEEVQNAIEEMGIVKPTPIQALTTQHVLDRRDVIAKAETGTGKTLAFGAGMISKLDSDRSTVLGLILCPTRELAQQVHDVMALLGATRGIKTCLIVGGDPPQPQVKALQNGAQLVVGTPGRVMDLYNQGFLSFPWTEFVVLDEADEMLEIGFIDDIKKILSYTPDERTTLLFSATFPPALLRLAREYTRDPVEIATAKGVSTVDHISQNFIKVDDEDKVMTLVRLIENSDKDDVFLVFGDRRTDVDQLMRRMERLPFGTKALHGGYDQAARFRVMSAFRTGEVKCLVATDVASRGLDVKHVTHVINFGVPRDVSIYTHRIGRTGRAGAKGAAITFVTYRDRGRWADLEGQMNWDVLEMPKPERGARSGGRGERSGGRGGRPERSGGRERSGRGEREGGGRRRREERPLEPSSVWGAASEAATTETPAKPAAGPSSPQRGEKVRVRSSRRRAEGEAQVERPAEDTQPRRVRTRTRTRSEGEAAPTEGRKPERKPREQGERRERVGRPPQADKPKRRPKPQSAPEPKPERAPKPAAAQPAAGGFGAGLDDSPAPPQRKPEPAPEPKAKPRPRPPEPTPDQDSSTGFGAGI